MSQTAGPSWIVAATLPSDLPMTDHLSAPLAASSARSAWPRIHSNGSSSGGRALVDLHDRPSAAPAPTSRANQSSGAWLK